MQPWIGEGRQVRRESNSRSLGTCGCCRLDRARVLLLAAAGNQENGWNARVRHSHGDAERLLSRGQPNRVKSENGQELGEHDREDLFRQ